MALCMMDTVSPYPSLSLSSSAMIHNVYNMAQVYAPAEACDPTSDELPTGIPGLGVKGRGPYWSY